jgi:hypothetical protein
MESNRMQMQKSGRWVWGLSFLICLLALAAAAQSGGGQASGLVAQLSKHYKLSTAVLTANGTAAIAPGAILTVHREGIVGFAVSDKAMEDICPSEFRGGALYAEKSTLCKLTSPQSRRIFRISEPVCVTAISASAEKETVSMYLVACHGGKPALATQTYYALLIFRFPKGFLGSAGATRIEETIDRVLSAGKAAETGPSVDRPAKVPANRLAKAAPPGKTVPAKQAVPDTPEQAVPPLDPLPPSAVAGQPTAVAKTSLEANPVPPAQSAPSIIPEPAAQSVPPLQPLPPPAATPEPTTSAEKSVPADTNPDAAAPQTAPIGGISVGQTPEQVKAVLGDPEGVVDLGAKFIYLYPNHLKIFFVSGKASEVQQLEGNQ